MRMAKVSVDRFPRAGLPAPVRNLSSEHGEREGEAPAALPREGATRAPVIEPEVHDDIGIKPINNKEEIWQEKMFQACGARWSI